jgi:hypothetical protein
MSVKYAGVVTLIGFLSGCTGTATQTVNYPSGVPATPTVAVPQVTTITAPSAPPAPQSTATQSVPVDTASERTLASAVAAYDRGDFGAATRLLVPITNDSSLDISQQIRALKTLAFSQCSTGAVVACRQSFERAFRVDPGFELATAERGHPIWGPQFERARKTVLGR